MGTSNMLICIMLLGEEGYYYMQCFPNFFFCPWTLFFEEFIEFMEFQFEICHFRLILEQNLCLHHLVAFCFTILQHM